MADYNKMMSEASSAGSVFFGDDDGPPQYRGAEAEFWRHVENVTGKRFDAAHRERTHFSCAC